jgi:hypothetical protein
MLPSDADGLRPPPAGAPNVFSYFNANEFVGETDSLRLYNFHAAFAVPANSTFTQRPESPIPVAAFDPRNPAGQDDIEQPPPAGSGALLDSIADRLMFRLAYRNFGGHESLVTNQSVEATTGIAGVRWYEIRSPLASPVIYQQGTYAPDQDHRWMGSAAMDKTGGIAIGYNVSSSANNVKPSIRYAYRGPLDAAGALGNETNILVGSGSQTTGLARWGDYSTISVDPVDGCTMVFTTEYLPANGSYNWTTYIYSFKLSTCQ